MFFQDLVKIRAQFKNNISSCYMALGDYSKADIYNNEAIILDPDYIPSYIIKC